MIETIPLVVRVSTTEVFQDPQLGQGASLIVVHSQIPSSMQSFLAQLQFFP
jgi:hypothetical protein